MLKKVNKQQQENNYQKEMGCGASMCEGATNQPREVSLLSGRVLRTILPHLKLNRHLMSDAVFRSFFIKLQININPYLLKPKDKLTPNEPPTQQIKIKWKIILYGTDSTLPNYQKCLGVDISKQKTIKNLQIIKQPNTSQDQQENQKKKNKSQQVQQQKDPQIQLLNHPCFQQIQKDLDRTFQLPGLKQSQFSQVLKRIANHFPNMGYTQGINFIVGYLLIIGFNSNDSFWIFVHLTLNRKYMLLGLFQDSFPLSKVYTVIFKNILKRTKESLYIHLFVKLCIDDSLWIFKWFMTCFLYSFPIEICEYVLDVLINLGGIGLVYFGVAIASTLQDHLLKLLDQCDISMFLADLKDIDCFNKFIKMDEILKLVYTFSLVQTDLDGSEFSQEGQTNIYGQYINAYYRRELRLLINKEELGQTGQTYLSSTKFGNGEDDECVKLLDKWYQDLIIQREQFVKSKGYNLVKGNKIRITLPTSNHKKLILRQKLSHLNVNKLNPIDEGELLYENSPTKPKQNSKQIDNQNHNSLGLRETIQFPETINQSNSKEQTIITNSKFRNGRRNTKKYKLSQQIGQLWDEEQNNSSKSSHHNTFKIEASKKQEEQRNKNLQNADFQLEINMRRIRKGSKKSLSNDPTITIKSQNHTKIKTEQEEPQLPFNINPKPIPFINQNDDILTMNMDLQHKISDKAKDKIVDFASNLHNGNGNNGNIVTGNGNMLLMTGKSIMSSLSVSNASISNKSSASSKQAAKIKKCKQNGVNINIGFRDCRCSSKHKNEQEKMRKVQISENGDEWGENKKQLRHRNSDLQKQKDEKQCLPNEREDRQRLVTYQEWMVNSHGPNNYQHQQEINSEVEILDGQLFKKKNKVSSKINGSTIPNNSIGGGSSQLNFNHNRIQSNTNINKLQYEQSCDSISLPPNQSEGQTSRLSVKGNINSFEIESIK